MLFGNVLRWQTEYLGRQLPVLPGARRLPPQGQAAGAPRRAGDGGLLRAAGHRLHRRGVPDGRGQQAPRLQGGAQRHRGAVAGHQARLLLRVPRPGLATASQRDAGAERDGAAAVRDAAARRPPARSARSAAWSSGPRAGRPSSWAAAGEPSRSAVGEQVLLIDAKERRYLVTLVGRRRVPLPRRRRRPRRLIGADEGIAVRSTHGAPLHRGPPDAGRLRAEDAARRAGHLPEGPRPDPVAGRHLPRRPGPRVRRRLRRAVDDAAAGRRRRRRLRAARGLRRPGPSATSRRSSASRRWPGTGSRARLLRGHRRDRPRPGRARPARAVAGRAPRRRRRCTPAGSSSPTRRTITQAAQLRGALDEAAASAWPRRSRCCTGPGTSRASRCAPTTAWWPTPASSPTPGSSARARSA